MSHRNVVITGIGVVAPNGTGPTDFWNSLVSGKSGIRVVSQIDTEGFASRLGGEVDRIPVPEGMDPSRFERLARYVQLGVSAGIQAFQDSGLLVTDENRARIGVSVGTAVGGTGVAESQHEALRRSRRRRVNPVISFGGLAPSAVPGEIARLLGIHGPLNAVTTGCAASSSAIVEGFERVRGGEMEATIVGGTEAPITEVVLSTYCELGQVSCRNDQPQRASRPFERDRDGIVLAEASAMLVLEDEERARARGARVYGRVLGKGVTSDAMGCFQSDVTGDHAAVAMRNALADARVPAEELDYVAACATSDRDFDKKESRAIRKAFGRRAFQLAVSSIKALTGHPLGACGALQAVAALLGMREDTIPPTWNYERQDPDCDLDYVPNEPRAQEVRYGLVNASGLGGVNVAFVLGRA